MFNKDITIENVMHVCSVRLYYNDKKANDIFEAIHAEMQKNPKGPQGSSYITACVCICLMKFRGTA